MATSTTTTKCGRRNLHQAMSTSHADTANDEVRATLSGSELAAYGEAQSRCEQAMVVETEAIPDRAQLHPGLTVLAAIQTAGQAAQGDS